MTTDTPAAAPITAERTIVANTCKTCKHWIAPTRDDHLAHSLCNPLDPQNDFKPMRRGFEVRKCAQPTQTFAESPVERNGFGMVDASEYYAVLVTAEDFGCVRHEAALSAPVAAQPAASGVDALWVESLTTLYDRTGDIKDINTLLVNREALRAHLSTAGRAA